MDAFWNFHNNSLFVCLFVLELWRAWYQATEYPILLRNYAFSLGLSQAKILIVVSLVR